MGPPNQLPGSHTAAHSEAFHETRRHLPSRDDKYFPMENYAWVYDSAKNKPPGWDDVVVAVAVAAAFASDRRVCVEDFHGPRYISDSGAIHGVGESVSAGKLARVKTYTHASHDFG